MCVREKGRVNLLKGRKSIKIKMFSEKSFDHTHIGLLELEQNTQC